MISSQKLIEKLEEKGVAFEIINKEEAAHFLSEHNYYIKLSSYRFNYEKNKDGKYVGLDFFHLKELSTVDMHLKFILLKICLNIEHSLKVNLLKDIEMKNLDAYEVAKKFLKAHPDTLKLIRKSRDTSYTKNLIDKHDENFPIWALLEVISFGEFVKFYQHYSIHYDYIGIDRSFIYNVKSIRNAAAHSNCLIHDLGRKSSDFNNRIRNKVDFAGMGIGNKSAENKLENKSINDFVGLMYVLDVAVKSDEIKKERLKELSFLFNNRMIRNCVHFKSNNLITSTYEFAKKIVDFYNNKL